MFNCVVKAKENVRFCSLHNYKEFTRINEFVTEQTAKKRNDK